jgi:hypothetical protein
MSVQMVLRLSEPFMISLAIPSVFVFLLVLLALVLFGYTVLFYWTYRLEFEESHLQTWIIYYPFVHPFRCAYDDIVQVRRGVARGLLEVVPREGKPLRVGARAFEGGDERLLSELSQHIGAERVEPGLRTRLWKHTWSDRLRVAFVVVIMVSQFGLLGLSIGRSLIPAFNLPRPLPDWVSVMTGIEARSIVFLCNLVVVGAYAAFYVWRRRARQSGTTQG